MPRIADWIALCLGTWAIGTLVFDGILNEGTLHDQFITSHFQFPLLAGSGLAAAGAIAVVRWTGRPGKWWSFTLLFLGLFLLSFLLVIPLGHWLMRSFPPDFGIPHTRFTAIEQTFIEFSASDEYSPPTRFQFWTEAIKNVAVLWVVTLFAFVSCWSLNRRLNRQSLFWLVLSLGCVGIAGMYLELCLDIRGAGDYIRKFHFFTPFLAAAAATTVTLALGQVWRTAGRPVVSALVFTVIFSAIWYFTVPWGDWAGAVFEKTIVKSPDPEIGYGWFYYDDSGMGAEPSSGYYAILLNSRLTSWWFLALPAFVFFAFLAKPKRPDAAENS